MPIGSFNCGHCGHAQRAEMTTGGKRDFLLQFATCPSCKQRSRLRAFVQRNALLYAGLCVVMFVASRRHPHVMDLSTQLAVDAVLLVLVVTFAMRGWRTLDRRVRWLDA